MYISVYVPLWQLDFEFLGGIQRGLNEKFWILLGIVLSTLRGLYQQRARVPVALSAELGVLRCQWVWNWILFWLVSLGILAYFDWQSITVSELHEQISACLSFVAFAFALLIK